AGTAAPAVAARWRARYCTLGVRSQALADSTATAIAADHHHPRAIERIRAFSNADSPRMTQPASASPTPCRLKEMRPAQIAAALSRDQRLIVPVGTCEQHGPHLPLGADTIIVERLADDLSAEFGVL